MWLLVGCSVHAASALSTDAFKTLLDSLPEVVDGARHGKTFVDVLTPE